MTFCWWTIYPNTYMTALLQALRQRGLDVVVCYFGRYDAARRALGWRERPLEAWEHRVRSLRDARRQIPDFDARVQMVPSFFNLTSWKLVLRCSFKGLPWFSITEGTRGRWRTRPLFALFCRFVDRFALKLFVEGGPRARAAFAAAGVRPEKIVPFAYATPEPRAAVKSPRADAGTVFVYAGSFETRKATDLLLAVWPRVRKDFPSARLVLAGGGPLRAAVEDAARRPENGIEYVGAVRQEEIDAVIGRGDVMLLPSRYDPWGVALAEGARAGLALVGSDRTGAADELIRDGETGFRVKAGDADDLLRVLRRYAADGALARRHGQAARAASEWTTGANLAARLVKELGV